MGLEPRCCNRGTKGHVLNSIMRKSGLVEGESHSNKTYDNLVASIVEILASRKSPVDIDLTKSRKIRSCVVFSYFLHCTSYVQTTLEVQNLEEKFGE